MPRAEFEFTLPGPPFSVNSAKKQAKKHREWKKAVGQAASVRWRVERENRGPLLGAVEVSITTYFVAQGLDVDNVIKPILDGLKGILYSNDDQVFRVISERIDRKRETRFSEPSDLLLAALTQGDELVHIVLRWEE